MDTMEQESTSMGRALPPRNTSLMLLPLEMTVISVVPSVWSVYPDSASGWSFSIVESSCTSELMYDNLFSGLQSFTSNCCSTTAGMLVVGRQIFSISL